MVLLHDGFRASLNNANWITANCSCFMHSRLSTHGNPLASCPGLKRDAAWSVSDWVMVGFSAHSGAVRRFFFSVFLQDWSGSLSRRLPRRQSLSLSSYINFAHLVHRFVDWRHMKHDVAVFEMLDHLLAVPPYTPRVDSQFGLWAIYCQAHLSLEKPRKT